jgi:hypothetical protein
VGLVTAATVLMMIAAEAFVGLQSHFAGHSLW